MSTTMTARNKAQIRYRILDRCFRDTSKEYTLVDLLNTVNKMLEKSEIPHTVSERQLYSDIAYMKSDAGFGIVLEHYRVPRTDGKGRMRFYSAYRYKDPKFSIEKIPLTHQQLRYVVNFVSSFEASINPDIAPWVKKTVVRVKDWIGGYDARPIFRYDNHEYQGGFRMKEVYDYFRILLESIDTRKAVLVYERSFDVETVHSFHPVYLKQYVNRWVVLGVTNEIPDKIQAIPLDKIYGIEEADVPYIHFRFNPDEYFEDFIGVYDPGGDPVDIHFLAYDWAAYYLANNPVHSSQRFRWVDDNKDKYLDVHLVVKINQELKFTLDRFSDKIKILAPQSFVDQELNSIRNSMKRYGIEEKKSKK